MNKKRVIRTVFEQVGIEPNITCGGKYLKQLLVASPLLNNFHDTKVP